MIREKSPWDDEKVSRTHASRAFANAPLDLNISETTHERTPSPWNVLNALETITYDMECTKYTFSLVRSSLPDVLWSCSKGLWKHLGENPLWSDKLCLKFEVKSIGLDWTGLDGEYKLLFKNNTLSNFFTMFRENSRLFLNLAGLVPFLGLRLRQSCQSSALLPSWSSLRSPVLALVYSTRDAPPRTYLQRSGEHHLLPFRRFGRGT